MLAQLLDCARAERVGRRDGDGKLCLAQHVCDLGQAGRLPRPVDSYKHDYVGIGSAGLFLGRDLPEHVDRAGLVEHRGYQARQAGRDEPGHLLAVDLRADQPALQVGPYGVDVLHRHV